jgi:ABC-2 type transport system permease protein
LPAMTLWQREVVRFLRQKNRVIGALATPIMFWFVIGSGMGSSFHPSGAPEGFTYLEYFFPGTLLLIMLFTAIFSTISIIEDRREGFLQGVLVAPISRTAIVLGKLLGGSTLALLQSILFIALFFAISPWTGFPIPSVSALLALIPLLFVIGFGLTALGYLIAWPLDSTQGFHAIMNLFLMPLWLLSGALFPADGASTWVKFFILINPLYYGLTALHLILFAPMNPPSAGPSMELCIAVLCGVAVVLLAASAWLTQRVRGNNP